MRGAIMVALTSAADDPQAVSAEVRERLDAAGLTDAKVVAVRREYEHVGPYPEDERDFDADGEPLRQG